MSAQKLKPSGVLGGLAGFLGFSVLAGVLVTAMVTPALAVTSVAANNTIGVFENLPDFIQIGEQSQQNTIYANRAGAPVQIATVFKQNRQEVAWKDVSQFLKDAAVAGEDRRFFEHGGVDLSSVARALIKNSQAGEIQSGSSTLDMQLVRNIAVEWGPKQVRANAIAPGLVRTDFARALWENPAILAKRTKDTPLGRIGKPDEIAGAAVFLASSASSFMTGQTIVIDGGVTTASV